jgi:hypothetical protein
LARLPGNQPSCPRRRLALRRTRSLGTRSSRAASRRCTSRRTLRRSSWWRLSTRPVSVSALHKTEVGSDPLPACNWPFTGRSYKFIFGPNSAPPPAAEEMDARSVSSGPSGAATPAQLPPNPNGPMQQMPPHMMQPGGSPYPMYYPWAIAIRCSPRRANIKADRCRHLSLCRKWPFNRVSVRRSSHLALLWSDELFLRTAQMYNPQMAPYFNPASPPMMNNQPPGGYRKMSMTPSTPQMMPGPPNMGPMSMQGMAFPPQGPPPPQQISPGPPA